jgi:hypothetical protein
VKMRPSDPAAADTADGRAYMQAVRAWNSPARRRPETKR